MGLYEPSLAEVFAGIKTDDYGRRVFASQQAFDVYNSARQMYKGRTITEDIYNNLVQKKKRGDRLSDEDLFFLYEWESGFHPNEAGRLQSITIG